MIYLLSFFPSLLLYLFASHIVALTPFPCYSQGHPLDPAAEAPADIANAARGRKLGMP